MAQTFKDRLRILYNESGSPSQEEFAKSFGEVSRERVKKWLSGTPIKLDDALKIAEAYNVSLDWLSGREKNRTTIVEKKQIIKTLGLNEEAIFVLTWLNNKQNNSNNVWGNDEVREENQSILKGADLLLRDSLDRIRELNKLDNPETYPVNSLLNLLYEYIVSNDSVLEIIGKNSITGNTEPIPSENDLVTFVHKGIDEAVLASDLYRQYKIGQIKDYLDYLREKQKEGDTD